MVTRQAPRADNVSKIVLKVVKENFDNICKTLCWLHFHFFHEFFYQGVPPLDAINR